MQHVIGCGGDEAAKRTFVHSSPFVIFPLIMAFSTKTSYSLYSCAGTLSSLRIIHFSPCPTRTIVPGPHDIPDFYVLLHTPSPTPPPNLLSTKYLLISPTLTPISILSSLCYAICTNIQHPLLTLPAYSFSFSPLCQLPFTAFTLPHVRLHYSHNPSQPPPCTDPTTPPTSSFFSRLFSPPTICSPTTPTSSRIQPPGHDHQHFTQSGCTILRLFSPHPLCSTCLLNIFLFISASSLHNTSLFTPGASLSHLGHFRLYTHINMTKHIVFLIRTPTVFFMNKNHLHHHSQTTEPWFNQGNYT